MPELEQRLAQQTAVSDLSLFAEKGAAVTELVDEAARRTAEALDVPAAIVVETADDVVLRAACGIESHAVGDVIGSADEFADVLPGAVEPRISPDASPLPGSLAASRLRSVVACNLAYTSGSWAIAALDHERDRFDHRDATFLSAIAHLLGAALRRGRDDRALGRADQTIDVLSDALAETLLPAEPPKIAGAVVEFRRPSRTVIGGDFYDAFPVASGAWVLVAGRSSPPGTAAVRTATRVLHTVRGAAAVDPRPAEVLRVVGESLGDEPSGRCAIAYALLKHQRKGFLVSIALAGANQPVVRRSDGSNAPLGVACDELPSSSPDAPTRELISVDPGECLVVPSVPVRFGTGTARADDLVPISAGGASEYDPTGDDFGAITLTVEQPHQLDSR